MKQQVLSYQGLFTAIFIEIPVALSVTSAAIKEQPVTYRADTEHGTND